MIKTKRENCYKIIIDLIEGRGFDSRKKKDISYLWWCDSRPFEIRRLDDAVSLLRFFIFHEERGGKKKKRKKKETKKKNGGEYNEAEAKHIG